MEMALKASPTYGSAGPSDPIAWPSSKACGILAEQLGAADKPLDLLVLSQGMATLQKHTPVAETGLVPQIPHTGTR